jgi:hypothetical protein
MRKQFYLDLVEKLHEVNTNDYPSEIKHFDLWNRQVEFLRKENPFSLPAVFVEFAPLSFTQLGQGVQEADLTFRLHVVSATKASPSSKSNYQDAFLLHLDLLDDIHYCLHAWNTPYSGTCVRTQSIPNHDHEEIIEEIEIYQMKVVDMSAVRRVIEVQAEPVFTPNLHKRS